MEFLIPKTFITTTKEELGEEEPELSRTNKGNVSNQTKVHLNNYKIRQPSMHVRLEEVLI